MKYLILLMLFCYGSVAFSDQKKEADLLFEQSNFVEAIVHYEALLQHKPFDTDINFKYGLCLLNTGAPDRAVKYLQLSAKRNPEAYLYVADAYYYSYQFEDAIKAYTKLSVSTELDSIVISIAKKIEKATAALRMLSVVEEIVLTDSMRVGKADFFKHYPLKGADAGSLFASIETDSVSLPLTAYLSPRKDQQILTDTVNGQTDMLRSYKLLDGWSEKLPLSDVINTSANENFPYLLSDGISLYFCSDGDNSIGGYDIFISRFSSDRSDFLLPENIGMPFNSPYNDYLLVVDEENGVGWFASDRYQHEDSVLIYQFIPQQKKQFVQTADSSALLSFAQLKAYRLPDEPVDISWQDSLDFVPVNTQSALKSMHFVITDEIAYTSVSQFVSDEAKVAYEMAEKYRLRLIDLQEKLQETRTAYAFLAGDSEQKKMVATIRTMEIEYEKIKELPIFYYKKARNEEIKSLAALK